MKDFKIQIDVKESNEITTVCNLYTGKRCVKILMSSHDYNACIRDGFFIRDGKERDSAGLLNTTEAYMPETQTA